MKQFILGGLLLCATAVGSWAGGGGGRPCLATTGGAADPQHTCAAGRRQRPIRSRRTLRDRGWGSTADQRSGALVPPGRRAGACGRAVPAGGYVCVWLRGPTA